MSGKIIRLDQYLDPLATARLLNERARAFLPERFRVSFVDDEEASTPTSAPREPAEPRMGDVIRFPGDVAPTRKETH